MSLQNFYGIEYYWNLSSVGGISESRFLVFPKASERRKVCRKHPYTATTKAPEGRNVCRKLWNRTNQAPEGRNVYRIKLSKLL